MDDALTIDVYEFLTGSSFLSVRSVNGCGGICVWVSGGEMASSQITDGDGTAKSLCESPQAGDGAYRFSEDATMLISTPLAVVSLDVLSKDLAGTALCSIDDEFSTSTNRKKSAVACESSARTSLCLPNSRAWAFGIGTHVIGLNANSFDLALSPGIKPFVGEGELPPMDSQFLSDAAASGRSMSTLLDRQEQLAR
ncbi:hypothetical protein FJV76_32275 [Mesorhizobium sp. WSM4303]|uniref:hypothetical protein n=1 Tax=unclassified Mesorhizobium TaxID=325217 RepID=UPI00115EA79A|nr:MULTISPECIES: hypothetical protein [unclassified Mesorhizobium]TRC92178.1 hypothetical protein FJV77_25865 [Mesorhizobium sp. WSM4306]TRC92809.1 hypothetical protein FJV76_32275 [Mesorhizobium sp. WSM4303]